MGGSFPPEFITWLEVLLGGESGMLACDYNQYNFYEYLNNAMRSAGLSNADIGKVKIWSADFPRDHPICGRWILPTERFVIQYDDHDQQYYDSTSRMMGNKGSVLVREKNVEKHRAFNVELFTRTDGNWKIRNILSGFYWGQSGTGFPADGASDCKKYTGSGSCNQVTYKPAFVPDACSYTAFKDGNAIEGEYTRTHRDIQVINAMRRWMGLEPTIFLELGLPSNCH